MNTNQNIYSQAMEITNQAPADDYFEKLVVRNMLTTGKTMAEAQDIERSNLAYFAGHFDNETRARVERLFKCAHPIFGAIAEKGSPTPEQAFEMGKQWAQKYGGGK